MHATPLETMNTDNVALDVEWAAFLTPDYCEHAFSAVKTFQREVFEGSGIEIGESLSSAIRAGS